MWGNQGRVGCPGRSLRPIPTCVGQPRTPPPACAWGRAYPHVCGATHPTPEDGISVLGLSPRVWGNPSCDWSSVNFDRPIPTCVGQPQCRRCRLIRTTAYPHVCGATRLAAACRASGTGLSPRVWGNLCNAFGCRELRGPIPTCVGQPVRMFSFAEKESAYPHVCGATSLSTCIPAPQIGLSPRVWGNPFDADADELWPGPIPTCVGQPLVGLGAGRDGAAYPHVCGATGSILAVNIISTGLSPRVWGNQLRQFKNLEEIGPIPTCVGQPAHSQNGGASPTAYPHVCGATVDGQHSPATGQGLSPRVWGNPLLPLDA